MCEAKIYEEEEWKTENCTTQREGNRDLVTALFLLWNSAVDCVFVYIFVYVFGSGWGGLLS